MRSRPLILAAAVCMLSSAAIAADPPATWDGLQHVKSPHMDAVYLAPGADFRGYSKVMLDPTEVAFEKDWLRDYNRSASLEARMSDAEARDILAQVRTGFEGVFRETYQKAGYQVVEAPGDDVLRVRTAVADLHVNAPDRPISGRSRTYAREAGEATVIMEARDSLSGALLGRVVDRRTAGDTAPYIRNSVTNRADFSALFRTWAKISADGLNALKTAAPAQTAQR